MPQQINEKFGVSLTIISIIIGLLSFFRDILNFETSTTKIGQLINSNSWIIFFLNAAAFTWIGFFVAKKYFKSPKNSRVEHNFHGLELVKSTEKILNDINDDTKASFIGLFKGWFTQLTSEIQGGGSQVFDIDSNYYANCLIEIETEDVYAIADLSNPVENFWLENTKPIGTQVKERIFLIDWKDFFNDAKLTKYFQVFKAHKQLYDIRVGHVPLKEDNSIFQFYNRVGYDLFIGKPHLTGGYIIKNGRILLRMVRNQRTYIEATTKYKVAKERSFDFKLEWSVNDLKRAWLEHNKIGHWSDHWGEIVENRTPDYFTKYDLHIRCWIPRYDDFIQGCFELIRRHTLQLFRGSTHKLKILEIGFGTGALTKYILDWIHLFDKPFEGTSNSIFYCGIDPAKDEMFANTNYQISETDRGNHFFTGAAFDVIPEKVKAQAPFDIICASLVLHDLNTDNPNQNFANQLLKFSSLLKEDGRVIIADLFGTTNRQNHSERFKYWRSFLNSNLTEKATNKFLDKNNDMVNCIKEESVMTIAQQNGFISVFENLKKGDRKSPFKFLILTKISSQGK